jgi:hypothetical protein
MAKNRRDELGKTCNVKAYKYVSLKLISATATMATSGPHPSGKSVSRPE